MLIFQSPNEFFPSPQTCVPNCTNPQMEIPKCRGTVSFAVRQGRLEAFDLLVDKYNASLTTVDSNGNHLLHLAAKKHWRLVKALLDHGADVNARNNKNATALHVAAKFN